MTKQKKLLLKSLLKEYKMTLNQNQNVLYTRWKSDGTCNINIYTKIGFKDTVIVQVFTGKKAGDIQPLNDSMEIRKKVLQQVYDTILYKYKNIYRISSRLSGDSGEIELVGAGPNIQDIKAFIKKHFSKGITI